MSSQDKPRLIVFDVEGVLIPKNRFMFEIGKNLSYFKMVKLLFYGFLYEIGALKLESTLRHLYSEISGVQLDTLDCVLEKISVPSTLQSFFSQIKERNCKIALISSGIPTVSVQKLAVMVGADYAYGVEAECLDGTLTGRIHGEAIEPYGKLKILYKILVAENLKVDDCIVVADDRNNRCVFLPGMLKIGFNPDFIIRVVADKVVMGKLSGILPILDGKPRKRAFPSTNDLVREDIHASGFFMPVIAALVGVPIVALIIIVIAVVYTVSELLRLEGREIPVVSTITRHAASQSELHGFAAAPLYFALGILLTLVLFPTAAGGAAVAMFCLGDAAASLFGGQISGSLPFNKGKTWEGSVAGFIFAFLAGLFFVPINFALVGAAFAMFIEVLPLPVNDNVAVPVLTGAFLTLLV
jgi:dolichol kinase/phosphoserine phosphatase